MLCPILFLFPNYFVVYLDSAKKYFDFRHMNLYYENLLCKNFILLSTIRTKLYFWRKIPTKQSVKIKYPTAIRKPARI